MCLPQSSVPSLGKKEKETIHQICPNHFWLTLKSRTSFYLPSCVDSSLNKKRKKKVQSSFKRAKGKVIVGWVYSWTLLLRRSGIYIVSKVKTTFRPSHLSEAAFAVILYYSRRKESKVFVKPCYSQNQV